MAKRRRRSAPKTRRRRRRNPVAVTAARSNPHRRRRRRNPSIGASFRDIPNMALQGMIGAGQVIAGKGVARLVRGKLNIEGATTTGSIVEVGVGIAGAMFMRRRWPHFAERFLIGAFIAPLETIAKQANIPYISVALGDEGTLPLIAGEDDLINIGGEYFPRALMGGEYQPAGMAGLGDEVPIQ